MNNIIFRMAARCEAAGRPNNEDNYQVYDNLTEGQDGGFTTDMEITLGAKGALMVVADGMGGMNAGEVASAIAVETVKEWFSPDRLTDSITGTSESIRKYLENAIVNADSQIKAESKTDKEKEGMGSTIVLAWIIDGKAYIAWCGDSRAYVFNPAAAPRLTQLSCDHSYVQELVNAGKLDKELAFDHPNSNIITRSLGDPRKKAKPDVVEYSLCDGDIIMLCSDGLSGMLRDEEIEEIMASYTDSMDACRNALWEAAEAAGWHDNVTTCLCQILSGIENNSGAKAKPVKNKKGNTKKLIVYIAAAALLIAAGATGYWFTQKDKPSDATKGGFPSQTDSIKADSTNSGKNSGGNNQHNGKAGAATDSGNNAAKGKPVPADDSKPETDSDNKGIKHESVFGESKPETETGSDNEKQETPGLRGGLTEVINESKEATDRKTSSDGDTPKPSGIHEIIPDEAKSVLILGKTYKPKYDAVRKIYYIEYVCESGDYLGVISRKFLDWKVSKEEIAEYNGIDLASGATIQPGQIIKIPRLKK